ncbi:MAG: 30S ribosomal protein S2 [Candidatus Nezhaarchaeota archaeon]|nr:30S ribosomal protein S2 [Candidatus Nezhaarchaeota archaeon]
MASQQQKDLLIPRDEYLKAGVHVGTHIKTVALKPFIYKIRPDGLCVIDLGKTDERIRVAAKMISRYNPPKVVVVSSRQYGFQCIEEFAKTTGSTAIPGRFIPGTFTNPKLPFYMEPELLLVTDARADEQAISEAAEIGIPIIALCDTDNEAAFVDLIVPVNNRGRKSLALVYWLLARQVLRERGIIPPDGDLTVPVSEFEAKVMVEAYFEES